MRATAKDIGQLLVSGLAGGSGSSAGVSAGVPWFVTRVGVGQYDLTFTSPGRNAIVTVSMTSNAGYVAAYATRAMPNAAYRVNTYQLAGSAISQDNLFAFTAVLTL